MVRTSFDHTVFHMGSNVLNDNGKRDREAEEEETFAACMVRKNLKGLRQLWESTNDKYKVLFWRQFGKLNDIIDVKIDEDAIRAFLKNYEPRLRTCVMPKLDLTPTLEEYHFLVSPTWTEESKTLYLPDLQKPVPTISAMKQRLENDFSIFNRWIDGALESRNNTVNINWQRIH